MNEVFMLGLGLGTSALGSIFLLYARIAKRRLRKRILRGD